LHAYQSLIFLGIPGYGHPPAPVQAS